MAPHPGGSRPPRATFKHAATLRTSVLVAGQISSGATVRAVERILGHASAAMTLDTYVDPFDNHLDAVASKLNDAMSSMPWFVSP